MLRDTWSRRQRQAAQQSPGDVFKYDEIPSEFRVQVFHLLRHTIGGYADPNPWDPLANLPPSNRLWGRLENMLAEEFGLFQLGEGSNPFRNFTQFLLDCPDVDQVLDCIELSFRAIDEVVRQWSPEDRYRSGADTYPDNAIATLNARFLEHRLGYQYASGRIVKIDNQMVHAEVVVPTLTLLSDSAFAGANQEFLTALDHLRHRRTKEAIVEAAKSFESTMKTICDLKQWSYAPTDTASKLIDVLVQKGLIPTYMQTQLNALRSLLESGAPTIRNKTAAHGQGAVPIAVSEDVARYAINTAAANITLLVEVYRHNP
jgi:hypothetical protein